jgi:quercetin dioxygenase-like cupin family protein
MPIQAKLLGHVLVRAGLALTATAVITTAATAGECPADKRKANVREAVTLAGKDVTDTVIASIDVAKEPAQIKDRQFRLRRLEIKPGGVVPWHSHGDRPAIIYIVQGEILEYASNCAVPILHKAGEVAIETSGVSHWWKNLGDQTVVLLSADLLRDKHDKHM